MASSPRVVTKFKQFAVPRQTGELARLRVVRGPDRGSVFVMHNTRASIGRGEENAIAIGDLKASRLHAEVTASATGWMVRDLGSSNGILHNGVQTRNAAIRSGDLVTVGETVLEFLGGDAPEQLLLAGPGDDLQAQALIDSKLKAKERARSLTDPFALNSAPSVQVSSNDAKKKKLRLAAAGAAAVLAVVVWDMVAGESPSSGKKSRKVASTSSEPQDLESILAKLDKPTTSRSAEMFFKQGFREYRERNYIRALTQFELVLQIVPEHEMARRYRDNSKKAIEEEVKAHLDLGKKTSNSGKLRESKSHFEAVLRLLNSDRSQAAYVEAQTELDRIKREMADED